MYLLASLPETYDMLVTALEVNMDVPQMEVVPERLLHEERKLQGREDDREQQKAMTVSSGKFRCFKCGKPATSSGIAPYWLMQRSQDRERVVVVVEPASMGLTKYLTVTRVLRVKMKLLSPVMHSKLRSCRL